MILHICCNLAGSTVFPQLFEALRAEGLAQTVFVPEKHRGNVGKNLPQGVKTHYALTVKRTDALLFWRKAARSVPQIQKTVDMQKVSLIHAHTLFTDGSVAQRLSAQTGVPYMVTLRYSDTEVIWRWEPHLRPMAKRILDGAARVIFLSEASREKVLGWFGGEAREKLARKSAVIPNGIKPEWLTGAARQAHGNPFRVGFAGRLNARKCPLDALAAVHRADAKQPFVLRACGAGPLEAKLRAALREGDRFDGAVAGMDAMKAFYAECDALLVPSRAETFGMVYLEAMSQGVPVLYTKGQGFDGQFAEGEVGYAVPCGDVQKQAEALLKLKDGYAARSQRCVERAKTYAWPLVAKRWCALYRAVTENKA